MPNHHNPHSLSPRQVRSLNWPTKGHESYPAYIARELANAPAAKPSPIDASMDRARDAALKRMWADEASTERQVAITRLLAARIVALNKGATMHVNACDHKIAEVRRAYDDEMPALAAGINVIVEDCATTTTMAEKRAAHSALINKIPAAPAENGPVDPQSRAVAGPERTL